MAILNITYQGQSADYELEIDYEASDADVRRIAVEVIQSGSVRGLHIAGLRRDAFDGYVVDRLRGPKGEQRIYLRPKVPFGAPQRREAPRSESEGDPAVGLPTGGSIVP